MSSRPWISPATGSSIPARGRLYYWPAGDSPGAQHRRPHLETLIRVAGTEDYLGDSDKPAAGFRFVGLTFSHTDRDVWLPNDAGLQHDWAMWDKDDACLRFRVARDCEVTGCTFRAAGGNAKACRADLYAQGIRIQGNTFFDLGAGGVLFAGYGPGTKDVNRGNVIDDNEFYHLGTLAWHAPAIFLWQSGRNRVTHNYVHDLPYNGIVLDGVRPRNFRNRQPQSSGAHLSSRHAGGPACDPLEGSRMAEDHRGHASLRPHP